MTTLQRLRSAAEPLRLLGAVLEERLRTGLVFDPTAARFRRDPARDPIHRSRAAYGWVLSRHQDVARVLRDPRFSADDRNFSQHARLRAEALRKGLADREDEDAPIMLRSDPPTHTRLRALVNKAFTPRAVERLRPRVEEVTAKLLEGLAGRERFDLIAELAVPLPVTLIAEMLGIPAEDRATFKRWSDVLVGFLDPLAADPKAMRRTVDDFFEYVSRIAAERRRRPADDLLSALVQAEEAGERLSEAELHGTVALLLAAGNETTTNLIGNGVLALLRHPDELARLRGDPTLLDGAVEELLRFDSPVQMTARIARADLDFEGRRFRRGQFVVLLLGSANRDPDVFPEPDRLDLGRTDNRHLSFGLGAHFCLGAPLARLEGRIALRELLRRFPHLRLSQEPRWRAFTFLRGVEKLLVETR
jgi:cytochrome P450